MLGMGGDQFLSFREAFTQNLSLLLCLEAIDKFLVGWLFGGGMVVQTSFRVQLKLS